LDLDTRTAAKIDGLKLRLMRIRHALLLLGMRLSCRQIETATGISWDSCRRTLFTSFNLVAKLEGKAPDFTAEFLAKTQAELDTITSTHTANLFDALAEWHLANPKGFRFYKAGPLGEEERITPARILALQSTATGEKEVDELLKDIHRLTGLQLQVTERGELRRQESVKPKDPDPNGSLPKLHGRLAAGE
jgi:hypothetical protein